MLNRLSGKILVRARWTSTVLLDLLNLNPKDMSWKIRWRMKHDRNPLFIVVQDKYRVKEYAKERGVKTAEMYHVTDNPETIPFDSLPDNYFIKANHGCKWNILCKDRELYLYSDGEDIVGRKNVSKNKITREECVQICRTWLKTVYSRREWAYQHIVPMLMVEEVLFQQDGGELMDYRCFTFNGKVKAIYFDSATFSSNKQLTFVDPNWQELKFIHKHEKQPYVLPEKPGTFPRSLHWLKNLRRDWIL